MLLLANLIINLANLYINIDLYESMITIYFRYIDKIIMKTFSFSFLQIQINN